MTSSELSPTQNSQSSPVGVRKDPHVLIVGAGVAGLFLAILLERAGISYQLYERAKEVKPLGKHTMNNVYYLGSLCF